MQAFLLLASLLLTTPSTDRKVESGADASFPAPDSADATLGSPEAAANLPPAPLEASLDDLLDLPTPMREAFKQQVNNGPNGASARFDRLVDFVFSPSGMQVRYDEAATHSVAQTWATRRANCVGFTLLFLALAREAGLPAQAQEFRRTLAWQQSSDTVFRSSHVNLRVRAGSNRYTVDVARGRVITVDEPLTISDDRLLAHYHNNIAIELMAAGRIDEALARIEQAISIDPRYATHWSNAGVIRLRAGDEAGAARAYRQALELDPEEYGTVFNLVQLLEHQRDDAQAATFRLQLKAIQRRDPLHHFLLGLGAERAGEPALAIQHYHAAVQLHASEHRFHAALARAYLADGDTRNAIASMRDARDNSSGPIADAYTTQLELLRNQSAD